MIKSLIKIPLEGNGKLVAKLYEPAADEPRTVVFLAPAMGVNQSYYKPFAEWLASMGVAVATIDYRGTGESLPEKIQGYKASIDDWSMSDCSKVVDFVSEKFPNAEIVWMGHSLGGQILPFCHSRQKISRAITVATGSSYWGYSSWPLNALSLWLWHVVVPLATRICGYFPGKKLKAIGDMPTGAIKQLREWSLSPQHLMGKNQIRNRQLFDSVSIEVVAFRMADDELINQKAHADFHSFYRNAQLKEVVVHPKDFGLRRIGHFGFFDRTKCLPVWESKLLPILLR